MREEVAFAFGRTKEAFEWMLEIDRAKGALELFHCGGRQTCSFESRCGKLQAALAQVVSTNGGLIQFPRDKHQALEEASCNAPG